MEARGRETQEAMASPPWARGEAGSPTWAAVGPSGQSSQSSEDPASLKNVVTPLTSH